MVAIKKILFLSLLVALVTINSSFAKTTNARLGDWNVIKTDDNGVKQCIAYSKPFRTKGSLITRDQPYAAIEYKGAKQYTFGVTPGYTIDSSKGVVLKIENKSRLLDVKLAATAWTFSANQDVNLMNDMLKSQKFMEIRSYNAKGEVSADYYSLKGLVNVVNYFDARCS